MTRGPYVGRGIVGIAAIVALGVAIGQWGAAPGAGAAGGADADRIDATAILGAQEHRLASPAFRGGEVAAFLGGMEVDLRDVTMAGGEAVVEVSAFMGAVELRVPDHWAVVSDVGAALGAAEIHTRSPPDDAAAPRLIVRGGAFMGAVVVRN